MRSIPSTWSELTFPQLLWVHTHGELRQGEVDINRRLRVFLYLADLEMFGKSYYATSTTDQTPFLDQPDITIDQLREFHRMLSGVRLSRDRKEGDEANSQWPTANSQLPPLIVLLRPIDHTHRPWYRRLLSTLHSSLFTRAKRTLPYGIPLDHLFAAVRHYTKFLDEPLTLTALPIDTITIDGDTYQLPQPLLSNLTYEQFNNCQHALNQFWREIDASQVKSDASQVKSDASQVKSDASQVKSEKLKVKSDASNNRNIDQHLPPEKPFGESDVVFAFLAHILTPISGHDTHNNPIYEYSSRHADTLAERFAREAPLSSSEREGVDDIPNNRKNGKTNSQQSTSSRTFHFSLSTIHFSLFPILYQLFQSSLLQYQTMFPHVFSSSGGKGSADNPIVSELGTLNAVMKYQGYTTQQEVYDTNALFVFKIIDSMTREAKEMEKASKRASRK